MPFGRRRDAPSTVGAARRALSEPAPAEATRLEELRDHLASLMDAMGKIADAVREEGTIANMPVILDEIDPETGPLRVKGLQERFCIGAGRTLRHAVYVFASPTGQGETDLSAQHQLQALFGDILAFNRYCQRAHLDEALGVALQSPHVPEVIDRILWRSAYFTAFFDNLVQKEIAGAAGGVPASSDAERRNVEKRLLMAEDKMLEPSHAKAMPPIAPSHPYTAVETMVEPHRGDYFLNGVYVPARLAEQLLRAAAQPAGGKLSAVA